MNRSTDRAAPPPTLHSNHLLAEGIESVPSLLCRTKSLPVIVENPHFDELDPATARCCTAGLGDRLRLPLLGPALRQDAHDRAGARPRQRHTARLELSRTPLCAGARDLASTVSALLVLALTACGGSPGEGATNAPPLPEAASGTSGAEPAAPIDASPGDRPAAQAALDRGRAFYGAADLPNARTAFEEATRLDSSFASAWYWLGRSTVLASSGMSYSRARTAFDRALALDPRLIEARWGLGLAAYGLVEYESAE